MVSRTPLYRERLRRGWPRSHVAEEVGVDVATVGRWERGEGLPHPIYRKKLCDLFEMNAENLGLFQEPPQEHDEEALDPACSSPKDASNGGSESLAYGDAYDVRETMNEGASSSRSTPPLLQATTPGKTSGKTWYSSRLAHFLHIVLTMILLVFVIVLAVRLFTSTTPSTNAFSCPNRSICFYQNDNSTGATFFCPTSTCRGKWYSTTVAGIHMDWVNDNSASVFSLRDVQTNVVRCLPPGIYHLNHSDGFFDVSYGVTSC